MKNGLTTSLLFSKMPKIWVGRTTINGEKKEDGLILTGKRDSRRRHYTTNFSENVLVAETSYQMLEVRRTGDSLTSFNKGNRTNFSGKTKRSMKLSGESYIGEYTKKL